jgi:hypothetical protein
MSAIHAIPMTKEELDLNSILLARYILGQQKMANEMHKDVPIIPDIKEKIRIAKGLSDKCLDRINKIEEAEA